MSDETTTTTDETTDDAAVDEGKETGKGLRTQLERALAENKALKADKLNDSIVGIGLDPASGLGKAIAKEYSGEFTPEAVGQFAATEYGHTVPEPTHPQAQAIVREQQRVDQVGQVTVPVTSQMTENQAIAEAEANGDFDRAGAIKAAQMERMMQQTRLA